MKPVNVAILAAQRRTSCTNARASLLAAFKMATGASIPAEIAHLFTELDNRLAAHEDALRMALDTAREAVE